MWRLDSGRIARKATEHVMWEWVVIVEPGPAGDQEDEDEREESEWEEWGGVALLG